MWINCKFQGDLSLKSFVILLVILYFSMAIDFRRFSSFLDHLILVDIYSYRVKLRHMQLHKLLGEEGGIYAYYINQSLCYPRLCS